MNIFKCIFQNPLSKPPVFVNQRDQKHADLERKLALAGASQSPVFRSVLGYADEHARIEHEASIKPDLTNEQRQYNAGRAAAAFDFALILRQIQAAADNEAAREARKAKF